MSVIINGKESQINILRNYLLNYKALCTGSTISNIPLVLDELKLSNKYYSADVKLLSVRLGDACSLDAEGFILLPSNEHPIDHEIHSIGEAATEKDLGLRLLVALTDETTIHSAEATKQYEEWAIENGFEYIEIGATDVTQGHQDREKFGLPRLMEALESNMWSTMQRHTVNAGLANKDDANVTAGSLSSTARSLDLIDKEKEDTSSASASQHVSAETSTDVAKTATPLVNKTIEDAETTSIEQGPDATLPAAATEEEKTNPFVLDMEDAEENDVMDKFTDFISQVKDFRQLATSGQLGDAERRDQAASMALRLSQMLAMGDDTDTSSSGDEGNF